MLTERFRLAARVPADRPDAWVLDVTYTLTALVGRDVTLGSPVTNGRPEGAGYGGFFWRAPPSDQPPRVQTAAAEGEASVNGSTEQWVAMTDDRYGLVFAGLAEGDHWFVRAGGYPGVCAALAYRQPRVILGGTSLTRRHAVAVLDGPVAHDIATEIAQRQGYP